MKSLFIYKTKPLSFNILKLIVLFVFFFQGDVFAKDELSKEKTNQVFHGYITNKVYTPLRLKVFSLDHDFFYFAERSLEDNSYIPQINLKLVAENSFDYLEVIDNEKIYIPQGTKFIGHISEIIPPKKFNRRGFYKVNFFKAICPDGNVINLKKNIISHSSVMSYSPVHHIGKTTLGLLGGSLIGALLSYELGGLALTVATKGYSLAAGAAVGGFIGTTYGLVSKGKEATVEPGSELAVLPVDFVSLDELKQVSCNMLIESNHEMDVNNNGIKLEVLSVKEKKDIFGEKLLRIDIKITNNSTSLFKINNFYLRDSQGKEYPITFIDFKKDIFEDFPPKQTKITRLEFFIEHSKANHWLVLKNKTFTEDVGLWKIEKRS